jgi:hypothetical protein
MAKQKYERKQIISIVGRLLKNDNGDFIVSVEDKDNVEEYDLTNILEEMEDSVISLTSDIY